MTNKTKKRIKRILFGVLMLYVLGGVILYFIQDFFLFHPQALSRQHSFAFAQPYQEYNITRGDSSNLNIVRFTVPNRKGIVLYFHGNMQNIERYAVNSLLFKEVGYEVWMIDYPGFGKSTGPRNEQRLYDDAAQFYRLAAKEASPQNIIIYGKSLGTGIAAQLASVNSCKKLILETPYYSIPQIAKDKFPIYPVKWLVKYNIPTYKYLPNVKAPVTAFHGTHDKVISYQQAKRLKEENPRVELITIPGGEHNNLLSYTEVRVMLQNLLWH